MVFVGASVCYRVKMNECIDREPRVKVTASSVADGNMSTVWEPKGNKEHAVDRMRQFAERHGFAAEHVVLMSLPKPFGDSIIEVSTHDGWHEDAFGRKLADADAIITRDAACVLALLTADCLPVVFDASDIGVAGLAHCGWQSTDVELARKVAERLAVLGARLERVRVHIGPCIKRSSYVFDPENLGQRNTPAWQPFIHERDDGKFGVDVVAYNIAQLVGAGISQENISVSPIDTARDPHYFSHYRIQSKKDRGEDPEEREGRFVTMVAMHR